MIKAGLSAIGLLDEGDFERDFSFGDVGNMIDDALDGGLGGLFAGTTNAFTLAMALVSILIQFKN